MLKTKNVFPSVTVAILLFLLSTILATLAPSTAGAEWAEWIIDADVNAIHKDNVNWAFAADEKYAAYIISPHVSLGRYYQLTETTRARLTVNAGSELYTMYPRLDNVTAGPSVFLTQKLGYGPRMPWIGLMGSVDYIDVRDNKRSGWLSSAALKVGERFSERFDAIVEYEYSYRNGKDLPTAAPGTSGRVFNLQNHRVAVSTNTLITQELLLTTGYAFLYGDINSTMGKEFVFAIKPHAEANILDDVYGETLWTYKMRVNLHGLFVNASYALSGHTSVNLGYTWMDGNNYGWNYRESVVLASFMYSY